MKTIQLPNGTSVPAFGLGTWHMGDEPARRAEEIATLRLGLEMGAALIDTAEMYGSGRAEELVGEALTGLRDKAFLVSKVLPQNASHRQLPAACDQSLRRLRTDRMDLYLLHWRGEVPLTETLEAFLKLQKAGKIRFFGVSNFDLADLEELWQLPGGSMIAADQLLYNLTRRRIEWDLLPRLRQRHVPVMAYSPVEQAKLIRNPKLTEFAQRYNRTPAQTALAWLLASNDVIVIPKTSRRDRLRENLGALDHPLSPEQLAELDQLFPRPPGPGPLEML